MKLLIMGISLLTLIAGCADNKEGSPTPLVSTKSYGQEVLEKCREQKTNWRAAWETYQRAEEDFFACFETENLSQYDAIKCGSNISDYAPKDFLKEADSANYPLYGKKECQKVGVDISSVIEDTMDRIEYVKNITDDRKQEKKILVKYSDLRPSSVPFSYNQSTESYSFEFCDVMSPFAQTRN